MTATERKVLLACGAAAGMAATFNTPIAGVNLAIELLLFEFKSRSFIPLVIASTLATSVHIQLLGPGQMFQVGAVDFGLPRALPFYLLLGLICGAAALGFSKALYWVEDQFEKLPIHYMWWPAIGALGLGIIGYFVPRVLGVGYDTISDILNTRMLLGAILGALTVPRWSMSCCSALQPLASRPPAGPSFGSTIPRKETAIAYEALVKLRDYG